ncbi:MAG: DUF3662 and FHA domain-containing protein [Olsenella sp.]|nr:DUF3662 and FHA domain-containing protein [Olsenella sp.]
MNLLKTFESRVNDAFGASPQGQVEPFSFKKLAKQAAREMQHETYEIDGVDTAPALFTILISSADDSMMRSLYSQLTQEIVSFVEAQANAKGYVFVGKPLARFMVDPTLRSGKFAVFAENVDARTLARLRDEEEAFLGASQGSGGAAAPMPAPRARKDRGGRQGRGRGEQPRAAVQPMPVPTPSPIPAADPLDQGLDNLQEQEFAPLVSPQGEDASAGLRVLPEDFVQDSIEEAEAEQAARHTARRVPSVGEDIAIQEPQPQTVPATQRKNVPLVNPQRARSSRESSEAPTCLLIDHQTGRTYNATAPATLLGRERSQGGIVIHDPNVSRRHAEITYDGRDWRITDLNSTNGTLVNDVDVDSCILRDGDLITVGLTNLEFRESRS